MYELAMKCEAILFYIMDDNLECLLEGSKPRSASYATNESQACFLYSFPKLLCVEDSFLDIIAHTLFTVPSFFVHAPTKLMLDRFQYVYCWHFLTPEAGKATDCAHRYNYPSTLL